MDTLSLTVLADDQLETARTAHAGRSARTVYGGHEHELRQTLIAVARASASTITRARARRRCWSSVGACASRPRRTTPRPSSARRATS